MSLNLNPNIPDPDGFYAALIQAQQGMSDEQAQLFVAKLALILANHVGQRGVLDDALAVARQNTLAHHP
ncbi:DUF2783 domain-containing protein [Pelomonas sp. CA6]|uniref:DUF2783 domain-containing protein n=1 Tax=Pelomonas sp. CA6 TaxID=2907999 RepID=UPI001F4B891F|nr:DUF2783 domain-containing protein [Pelomonas sp. CA6]MCH7342018.1 DUF2783 domain-containing protein [Pelomonas sp. CA6]